MSGDNPSLGFLANAITDLATRMEELAAQQESMLGGGAGSPMADRVRALEAAVVDLSKVVGKANKPKNGSKHESHLPWHRLSVDQAEKRWLELHSWVSWLVLRNDIGPKEVPTCWYLHGGYVDELEALRWAWLESYGPDAKGIDPVWWREALSRARMRLPTFNVNGCSTSHSPNRPRALNDDRPWRDFLAEDLAARLPTPAQIAAG